MQREGAALHRSGSASAPHGGHDDDVKAPPPPPPLVLSGHAASLTPY